MTDPLSEERLTQIRHWAAATAPWHIDGMVTYVERMRSDIPDLLDEIHRLREENKALRRMNDVAYDGGVEDAGELARALRQRIDNALANVKAWRSATIETPPKKRHERAERKFLLELLDDIAAALTGEEK